MLLGGFIRDRFERSTILGWFVSCSVLVAVFVAVFYTVGRFLSPTGYLGLKGGGGRVVRHFCCCSAMGLGLLASRFDLAALGAFVAGATISQTQLVKILVASSNATALCCFMSVGMWVDPLALM